MSIAEKLEEEEKYEEAYEEYKKQLLLKNDDIDLLIKLAHIAQILEKTEDSKNYYNRILELDPANILAHEQLIDIYINEDKFKYYLLRGELHALQRLISHAKHDYKKAISAAKDQEEALPARYLYAGVCEEQQKYTEAIDEYLKIADYDNTNPIVYLKLAELYEKTEGIQSSIHILESARQSKNITEYDEVLAEFYIKNSEPEKALELTKRDLIKARALIDLGKNEDGYEILIKNKEKYSKEGLFYSLLAQYYYQKDMFEDAFSSIKEFEKLVPGSPLIYQMRALIYEKMDDAFNEHLNWGKYNIVRGDKDVALNEYMTAYRYNDKDIDLVETIAALLELEGDKTKASEFYERLVEIEPNNVNALQKLAEFRISIGDYNTALMYIEQIKEKDLRNQYALDNYDLVKDKAENGLGFISFLKGIFGKRMG